MKWISIVAVIAAVALVGCQAKGPQTKELAMPETRSLEDLSPDPAADTSSTDTLPPIYSDRTGGLTGPLRDPPPDLTPPPAPGPRTHTIQKNDTLWSLAVRYLGDGQRWREIAAANPGIKASAMPVGTKLLIPEK